MCSPRPHSLTFEFGLFDIIFKRRVSNLNFILNFSFSFQFLKFSRWRISQVLKKQERRKLRGLGNCFLTFSEIMAFTILYQFSFFSETRIEDEI